MPTHDAAKLSTTEKVGYSLADGAAQFVFLTMVNYQAGFYTDAMGIRAADASWLVLIAAAVGCLFRSDDGLSCRSHPNALGALSSVDSLVDCSLGRVHGACLYRAAAAVVLGYLCLRAGHKHRPDDRLLHEQHALLGAHGGDDGQPEGTHQSFAISLYCGDDGAAHRRRIHTGNHEQPRRLVAAAAYGVGKNSVGSDDSSGCTVRPKHCLSASRPRLRQNRQTS